MRLDHITALTRTGTIHKATHNGALLISEGHFAVSVPLDFSVPESAKPYGPLEKLWADALTVPKSPLPIGGCYAVAKGFVRKIGNEFMDERFGRCFGESAEWTSYEREKGKCLLAHVGGELVGAAMVMEIASPELLRPTDAPTDAQLFGDFACAENGWHCLTEERLTELIKKAKANLDHAERHVEEADAELQECKRDLRMLRGLKPKVAA